MRTLTTDYLVVGAGAMGMAFTDALIDHADAHVILVDRRHAAGGHWQDAYPFVQLHQASLFYGVASTELGTGAVQQNGPEAGLQERARRAEIQHYYDLVLQRFIDSGRVTFLGGRDYVTDGSTHFVTSRVSGETVRVQPRRVVDATYLSPTIPATSPPPFAVIDDAKVAAVGTLGGLADAPDHFVIVGSGKTGTDAIVWLRSQGVPADRISWVRSREPWMLNRARVQPNPVVALELAADTMAAAAASASPEEMFLRLESAGVMLRIDRNLVPLWQPDRIRLQTIRAGFPCFGAALAGFVEATRDDDRERNRLCPPNTYADDPATWARMQQRGSEATRLFGAEPDIAAWANSCALNPARIRPEERDSPAVRAAAGRLEAVTDPGLAQLNRWLGIRPSPAGGHFPVGREVRYCP